MPPTAPSPVGKGLLPDQSLAAQAHALRVLADLIENVGIPGLHLMIDAAEYTDYEIAIQGPRIPGHPG